MEAVAEINNRRRLRKVRRRQQAALIKLSLLVQQGETTFLKLSADGELVLSSSSNPFTVNAARLLRYGSYEKRY
jgi:hypothetical protein